MKKAMKKLEEFLELGGIKKDAGHRWNRTVAQHFSRISIAI